MNFKTGKYFKTSSNHANDNKIRKEGFLPIFLGHKKNRQKVYYSDHVWGEFLVREIEQQKPLSKEPLVLVPEKLCESKYNCAKLVFNRDVKVRGKRAQRTLNAFKHTLKEYLPEKISSLLIKDLKENVSLSVLDINHIMTKLIKIRSARYLDKMHKKTKGLLNFIGVTSSLSAVSVPEEEVQKILSILGKAIFWIKLAPEWDDFAKSVNDLINSNTIPKAIYESYEQLFKDNVKKVQFQTRPPIYVKEKKPNSLRHIPFNKVTYLADVYFLAKDIYSNIRNKFLYSRS